MIGLLLVAAALVIAWRATRSLQSQAREDITSPKTSAKLKKLWSYVTKAIDENRYRAAERALLSILRIDHKNTAAYNRLGMLYAKQQNFEDAIECFDIASSLTPTVATLYNLGLVQYEYGNYDKAVAALEKVIDLEPNVKRLVAYARALDKAGSHKKVIEVLEQVVEEDSSQSNLEMLAQAHERNKDFSEAEEVRQRAAIARAKERQPRKKS